ncbi:MAG TPA: S9 family peptidase [Bryobacteraceae bacterium]|nr:S9 family peptidase [Bryobacteraceae bacterium]
MNPKAAILFSAVLAAAAEDKPNMSPKPPIPAAKPHKLKAHNHERIDPWYWLRDRENPDVIAYLNAENKYLEETFGQTKELRSKLVGEYKSRIPQTDVSVPYMRDGYLYYSRMEQGKNYPILCRRKGSTKAPEEVLVDGNKEAQGHSFLSVGAVDVSPNTKLLAYGLDTVGRRFYTVRFRNLDTGELLPDVLKDITPSLEWANDNKTVFYVKQDPQTLRADRVFRHVLGTDPAQDQLVFEEKDAEFHLAVTKSRSRKYVIIASTQTTTRESRYIDASQPGGEFTVFQPRSRGIEYDVDHFRDTFYVRTNHEAKNFRLMTAPESDTSLKNWRELLPHRSDVLLEGLDLFNGFMLVSERRNGLMQFRVRPWSGEGEHYVDFGEPAYAAFASDNHEPDTTVVRYKFSSLATPSSVYDYDTKARTRTLLKRDAIGGGFSAENYKTARVYATSHDGVKIPVSVVHRKETPLDGTAPLLQYGYGSYGISMDAGFNPYIISLLDRGFVYAIAHIRGGEEMGRQWYEDGKLMKKKNTFRDFIAVTENLIQTKFAHPKKVYAMGGSAGGLLMGAVMNMRPDLYNGIIAAVPFVDVVTTMLDETIPLTTFEYEEWGNPNQQPAYEYMLSYSPFDQVEKKAYPNLLVMTGLHDSQVQYWEPAKWVAKLRTMKTDNNRLLFQINMEAGHGGASARERRYEEIALQHAFLLELSGKAN